MLNLNTFLVKTTSEMASCDETSMKKITVGNRMSIEIFTVSEGLPLEDCGNLSSAHCAYEFSRFDLDEF
jgi:hypothetical protein